MERVTRRRAVGSCDPRGRSADTFFLFRAYGLMPHLGIAVATTLGGWLNAGLLYWTLAKHRDFVADERLKRSLPRIVLATLVMSVVLWLVAEALGSRFEPPTRELTRAVAVFESVKSEIVTA